jgi:hypothetical protein
MLLWRCAFCPVLACCCALALASGQDRPKPLPGPENGKVVLRDITIYDGNSAWWLGISPDGSGILVCGNNPTMNLRYKKGTINFAAALKALQAVSKPGNTGPHAFSVVLPQVAEQNIATSVGTNDAKVVLPLFERAYQAIPAKDRQGDYDKAWKEYPPWGKAKPPEKEQER